MGDPPRRRRALAALALLVAFQFAAVWVGMYLGLVIGNEETAAQASILIFPVTMLSNVFVPTSGMPPWLRTIADWNPVSALAAAARQLLGIPPAPANGAWPLEHPVSPPPWPGPRYCSPSSCPCAPPLRPHMTARRRRRRRCSAEPLIAEADCFACQRRPSDRGRTRVNVSKTV